MVHGKGAGVEVVLVPDAAADGEAIVGLVDGVVDGGGDGQDPGEEGEDLVREDGAGGVRLALAKGVVCEVSGQSFRRGTMFRRSVGRKKHRRGSTHSCPTAPSWRCCRCRENSL